MSGGRNPAASVLQHVTFLPVCLFKVSLKTAAITFIPSIGKADWNHIRYCHIRGAFLSVVVFVAAPGGNMKFLDLILKLPPGDAQILCGLAAVIVADSQCG